MSKHDHNFFYPLVFPFHQKKWFSRTWWLNLIALIPFVDLILFSGWRYSLIRNMANNEDEILPEANIATFFKHGVILWFVATLFIIIPMFLIFTLGSGVGGSILDFGSWFTGTIVQDPNRASTETMLTNQATNYGVRVFVEFIWVIISIPILSTGLARYAITGKVKTLFNLPVNTLYAIKYFGAHFMMWIFKFFMVIFVSIVTFLLFSSVVLTVFAPMFGLCVYYWSTGFEIGHLAVRIKNDKKIGSP